MNPERHARVKELFFRACELPPGEVGGFLAEACGGDGELRREVEALLDYRETDTRFFRETRGASSSRGGSSTDSADTSTARFHAGDEIAGRYRIVTRLGRGGMGEVYRALDLRLGQEVALKFLPLERAADPAWLERLREEVKSARAVSHPNVCRVHDLGEEGGEPFLTMEYVDGEDLASLLHRIGRLPIQKATEIGRQLCAGLGAAHARGVLHRDLKPANVMLDGDGQVRVTDFGLAMRTEGAEGTPRRGGTPAYMAPEQVIGAPQTAASDVFSLGAVLYELFTGRRAIDAPSAESRRRREASDVARPSSWVPDVPDEIERVILRCLRVDPRERPRSVAEVAAGLAGSDPLEVALAAGEMPSPEAVAASPAAGSRLARPGVVLAVFLVLLVASVLVSERAYFVQKGELSTPPVVLVDRGRALLAETVGGGLGHSAWGFFASSALPTRGLAVPGDWLLYDRRSFAESWDGPYFWYRESAAPLVPESTFNLWSGTSRVDIEDPPLEVPGHRLLMTDSGGGLVLFGRVGPGDETEVPELTFADAPDWDACFERAGLDRGAFQPTGPRLALTLPHDGRFTWTGRHALEPDREVVVEAATWRGRPVLFAALEPLEVEDAEGAHDHDWMTSLWLIGSAFGMLVLVIAVPLAVRNYRRGLSDRRGALLLAAAWLALHVVRWTLRASHAADPFGEELLLRIAVGRALLHAGLFWVAYTALEPMIRRSCPRILVSWSRMLSGRWRDPLLGRDVLIGCVVGAAWALLEAVRTAIPTWLESEYLPFAGSRETFDALLGARHMVATGISQSLDAAEASMRLALELTVLIMVFRRTWVAALVLVLLQSAGQVGGVDPHELWTGLAFGALGHAAVEVLLLVRYGFTAVLAAHLVLYTLKIFPMTLRASAWYFDASLFAGIVVVSLAGLAWHAATRGREPAA